MKRSMLTRVKAYLTQRQALGYKLLNETQRLIDFARYADRSGHRGPLTRKLAITWASLPPHASPAYRAARLATVRVFAQHQGAVEPGTEIPARHALGPTYGRKTPHLFTARQLRRVLRRTKQLSGRLRPNTYWTLLSLLASTGLRISEALALAVQDVDLGQGVLTIRQSKFQHSRALPLHRSALPPLRHYAQRRNQQFPHAEFFFVSDRGQALTYGAVSQAFRSLVADIPPSNGRPHVRLHDLRHSFACQVLLRWQRSRRGAVGRLLILSRYLGHTHFRETYWYLTATPELLQKAAEHFTPPAL
jgi:integrase